ncbi:MAG: hypothetical protein ACOYL6_06040 [Bacteriovoracaceae bacterium]
MRNVLNDTQVDGAALKTIESFHGNVVNEVMSTVSSNKVVVVGMAHNPFVKKARKALEEKKHFF